MIRAHNRPAQKCTGSPSRLPALHMENAIVLATLQPRVLISGPRDALC